MVNGNYISHIPSGFTVEILLEEKLPIIAVSSSPVIDKDFNEHKSDFDFFKFLTMLRSCGDQVSVCIAINPPIKVIILLYYICNNLSILFLLSLS